MITRNDYQFSLKRRNFFKTTSERRILWRLKIWDTFFEEVMITFQSENTFFHHWRWWRSLFSDHYFVSITLKWWAKRWSLRRHYGVITGWLRLITVESDHHLFHYPPLLGRWWVWVMITKVMITFTIKKLKSNWAYKCMISGKKTWWSSHRDGSDHHFLSDASPPPDIFSWKFCNG